MSDTLVPEPQASIFDSVTKALGNDEDAARRVMLNPNLAKGQKTAVWRCCANAQSGC